MNDYLWYLQNHGWIDPFQRQALKIYPKLKEKICEFRNKYGLGDLNFKQIDKFLYYEGGKLFKQKENLSPVPMRVSS